MTNIVDANGIYQNSSATLSSIHQKSGYGIGYASGQWYSSRGLSGTTSTVGSAAGIATGLLYFFPFMVQNTNSFSKIGVWVSTGSASINTNLGIYANNGAVPTGSPLANTTSGSINTGGSSSVPLTFTFSSPINLLGGTLYWLAMTVSASGTLTFQTRPTLDSSVGTDLGSLGQVTLSTTNNSCCGYSQSFTYNAVLPAESAPTIQNPASGQLPDIYLQAS